MTPVDRVLSIASAFMWASIRTSPLTASTATHVTSPSAEKRGVKKDGVSTVTTQFTGVFRSQPNEQTRFLTLLRGAH